MDGSGPKIDVVAQLDALRRYAQVLTRDPVDAEDLVQDALVRAYTKRHTFDPRGDLRAWLFSILYNSFVSSHRRRRAEAARNQAAADLGPTEVAPDQEHVVELARVRGAFARLPTEQRAVLHLVTIEGLTYQDAARALEIPVGTVMSRLSRARRGLRALLDDTTISAAIRPQLHIVGGSREP